VSGNVERRFETDIHIYCIKIHGGIQKYNIKKTMFSGLTSKGFCLKLFSISEGSGVSYLYVPFSFP